MLNRFNSYFYFVLLLQDFCDQGKFFRWHSDAVPISPGREKGKSGSSLLEKLSAGAARLMAPSENVTTNTRKDGEGTTQPVLGDFEYQETMPLNTNLVRQFGEAVSDSNEKEYARKELEATEMRLLFGETTNIETTINKLEEFIQERIICIIYVYLSLYYLFTCFLNSVQLYLINVKWSTLLGIIGKSLLMTILLCCSK